MNPLDALVLLSLLPSSVVHGALQFPIFKGASSHLDGVSRGRQRDLEHLTLSYGASCYYTSIQIGTPSPQSFNVGLDTLTTADILIVGSPCNDCTNNSRYDAAQSSTAVNVSASSHVVEVVIAPATLAYPMLDTVSLGGVAVQNSSILEVVQTSPEWLSGCPISGFLGLARVEPELIPLTTTVKNKKTFWTEAVKSIPDRQDDDADFSFVFSSGMSGDVSGEENAGTFVFGGVDPTRYVGEIEYLEMGGADLAWSLNVTAVNVQGQDISVNPNTNSAKIAPLHQGIYGPTADIAKIYEWVPGANATFKTGFYLLPCNTEFNFSMSFGGRSWAVNLQDMFLEPVDGSGGLCVGSLVPIAGNYWIIGYPFLRNVYSAFKSKPPSIGFAELASFPAPIPTAAAPPISTSFPQGDVKGPPKRTSPGIIAAGILGSLLAIIVAAVSLYRCRSRRARARTRSQLRMRFTGINIHPPSLSDLDSAVRDSESSFGSVYRARRSDSLHLTLNNLAPISEGGGSSQSVSNIAAKGN